VHAPLRHLIGLAIALALLGPTTAMARPTTPSSSEIAARGRPKVDLDKLGLPDEARAIGGLEAHLRKTLRREARRADWGASRGNKIKYRFFVEELKLREEAGVLHVSCTAVGKLPKGKSAKSQITFGGDPRERNKVVKRVLEIVARGVITRLAQLERARRTGR
jgi:hypothetical protein